MVRRKSSNTKAYYSVTKKRLERVQVSDELLIQASTLCAHLGADGLRGELTMMRTMRALAAESG
jgi:magnesium chelatase subunit I